MKRSPVANSLIFDASSPYVFCGQAVRFVSYYMAMAQGGNVNPTNRNVGAAANADYSYATVLKADLWGDTIAEQVGNLPG